MGDAIKVLAIDIGGTHLRATAIDETGTVLHRAAVSAEPLRDGNPVAVLREIIQHTQGAVGNVLAGVVVGVPSILDSSRRGIVRSPNLPAFEGSGIAEALEAACGLPVLLDHDATLQTRGEAEHGSAAGRDLVLGIYFGTGVGGAFIDHGRLMGGIYRMQLGHVPLRGEGRVGTGGAIDCVEAYASGVVLQALAREHGVPVATLFSRPATGKLDVALKTFVRDQALTIALAMTLTDPEIAVIGGGVVEMAGYPFDVLVRQANECLSPVLGRGIRPIVRATLGPAAASWGALQLLRDALRDGPPGSVDALKSATR
jgi:allose kinase